MQTTCDFSDKSSIDCRHYGRSTTTNRTFMNINENDISASPPFTGRPERCHGVNDANELNMPESTLERQMGVVQHCFHYWLASTYTDYVRFIVILGLTLGPSDQLSATKTLSRYSINQSNAKIYFSTSFDMQIDLEKSHMSASLIVRQTVR